MARHGRTLKEANDALRAFQLLASRTPLEAAQERLRRAKAGMTEAAQAVLSRDPDAAERGDLALLEFHAAKRALEALERPV